MTGIWVLLYEVNDYCQYGEYFSGVWDGKPAHEILAKHFHDQHCLHVSDFQLELLLSRDVISIDNRTFRLDQR